MSAHLQKTVTGQPAGRFRFRRPAIAALGLFLTRAIAFAGDPALPGHHPLTQTQAGSVLIAELRCAVCHSGVERGSLPEKSAPDLSAVGSRVSHEFLRRFIASPVTAHPGTTMPDILASRPEAERDWIADALTHFLIAQSQAGVAAMTAEQPDLQQGRELYHSVGCVACHGPKDASPTTGEPDVSDEEDAEELDPVLVARRAIKPAVVSLEHVSAKYRSAQSLAEFLFQPLHVRASGRMPDMKLTPAESLALAGYLMREQTRLPAELVPDAALVAQGRQQFQEVNCAACHALPGMTAEPLAGSLAAAELTRGCLSKQESRSPRFLLNDLQGEAIRAAVRSDPVEDSGALVVAKTLTAFRCLNCHVRDDYGGVHDAHNSFFAGTEQKLGDDGRIPPPLTLVGAKLQPAWMKTVLFDGESVRHYMATRMPQYGTNNLQHLPAVFGRLDVMPTRTITIPSSEPQSDRERAQEKAAAGGGPRTARGQGRELRVVPQLQRQSEPAVSEERRLSVSRLCCGRFARADVPVSQRHGRD